MPSIKEMAAPDVRSRRCLLICKVFQNGISSSAAPYSCAKRSVAGVPARVNPSDGVFVAFCTSLSCCAVRLSCGSAASSLRAALSLSATLVGGNSTYSAMIFVRVCFLPACSYTSLSNRPSTDTKSPRSRFLSLMRSAVLLNAST